MLTMEVCFRCAMLYATAENECGKGVQIKRRIESMRCEERVLVLAGKLFLRVIRCVDFGFGGCVIICFCFYVFRKLTSPFHQLLACYTSTLCIRYGQSTWFSNSPMLYLFYLSPRL